LTENSIPTKNFINIHNTLCHIPTEYLCETIIISDSVKYLGVEICNNMKWKDQINVLSKKVRKIIYIFSDLRNILDSTKLQQVYLTLVEPIINYGIIS
jgi:hypothetical protein